jgi:hypothetical protein
VSPPEGLVATPGEEVATGKGLDDLEKTRDATSARLHGIGKRDEKSLKGAVAR